MQADSQSAALACNLNGAPAGGAARQAILAVADQWLPTSPMQLALSVDGTASPNRTGTFLPKKGPSKRRRLDGPFFPSFSSQTIEIFSIAQVQIVVRVACGLAEGLSQLAPAQLAPH